MKKKEQQNSGTALKKGIATLLCTALLAVFLLPMGASAAVGIAPGTGTGAPALTVNTTVVGFAGQEWWVIGDATTGVAPLANHVTLLNKNTGTPYGTAEYNSSNESIYAGGGLHTAMGNIHTGIANSKEQALITLRTIDGIAATNDGQPDDSLANQPLWPLSFNEWNAIGNTTVRSYGDYWWLRSPDGTFGANFADSDGASYGSADVDDPWAARPALNLNLASVIFASSASGASVKAAAVGGLEGAEAPGVNLKFTMQHASQTLDVIATTAQSTQTGSTLQFSYANATAGANQFVSCVLEQGAAVTHYGKLADSSSAASGTLSVPLTGLANGTYTLKIFSEEANGEMFTDFASNPISMTVTVASGSGTVGGFGGTVLSNNSAGLASVAGQTITAGSEAGTQATPKTAAITVANSVASLAATDIVTTEANATVNLYTDNNFATEGAVTLGVGANHAYVKVTAEDGTELYYDVTVIREAPLTLTRPAPATHAWDGGYSTVTLTGTNMTDKVKLALFNGTTMQGSAASTTGNDTTRTARLTLPTNINTTADAVYTVKASIDGGATWLAAPTAPITVTKAVFSFALLPPAGNIYSGGDYTPITFNGNLSNLNHVLVNKIDVLLDRSDKSKVTGTVDGVLAVELFPGSVVVILKAAYLDTLPNGTHTVELHFTDGYGTAQVVINRPAPITAPQAQGGANTSGSPQTGDASNTPLWLVLGLSALLGLATFATKARKLLKNNTQAGK